MMGVRKTLASNVDVVSATGVNLPLQLSVFSLFLSLSGRRVFKVRPLCGLSSTRWNSFILMLISLGSKGKSRRMRLRNPLVPLLSVPLEKV